MKQKEVSCLDTNRSVWGRLKRLLGRWWPLYLMMVPGLLYIIVYKYVPMGGIIIAFKNYKVKAGIWGSEWVDPWYKYFAEFFKSPANVRVITNTLIISLGKILVGLLPPLIFALAISECRSRGLSRIVQTVAYLPHFLSWVVVYGICMTMLSETTGILNNLLKELGFGPIPFLTSNNYFQGTLIFSDLWKSIGWGSITYLAAIMGIDQDLYEAAKVDGCGRFRQIWHITLPGIRKIQDSYEDKARVRSNKGNQGYDS